MRFQGFADSCTRQGKVRAVELAGTVDVILLVIDFAELPFTNWIVPGPFHEMIFYFS